MTLIGLLFDLEQFTSPLPLVVPDPKAKAVYCDAKAREVVF
jgi:hypothetical protein